MDIGKEEIDRGHRNRGWLSIGYHYVIRRDGTIEEGRPEEQAGAHAKGHNYHSIGICLVGGLSDSKGEPEDNFTEAQYAALRDLVDRLQVKYMGAKVLGHRDLPNVKKDCPCFEVSVWDETTRKESI